MVGTYASRWIPREAEDRILAHQRRLDSSWNTSFVGFDGLQSPQHAGHINVDIANGGNVFYWHFAADPDDASESAATLPLVIWLQGGPGCSSLIGLFVECGPFRLHEDGSMTANPHGWHKAANVVFVDQPVGTGMSTVNPDAYPSSGAQVAAQFYLFLVGFLQRHPQYVTGTSTRPIYLFGESHAGRWIPQFYSYIAAQNAQHAPPSVQVSIYIQCQAAIDAGDMNTPACFRNLDTILTSVQGSTSGAPSSGLNVYDVRLYGSVAHYPLQKPLLAAFLNRADVRRAMNWSDKASTDVRFTHTFEECNAHVNRNLAGEDAVSTVSDIQAMLAGGVRVLLYNGQWDLICNALNTEHVVQQLEWPGQAAFTAARRFTWRLQRHALDEGGPPAGFVQTGGNLTTIVVRDAGHMVPFNAPEAALDMVRRFIHDRSFQDIVQAATPIAGGHATTDDDRCGGPSTRPLSFSTTTSTAHMAVVAATSAVLSAVLSWLCLPRIVGQSAASAMGEEVEKHILRKYDLLQKLGKGAYGIVWKALDKSSRQPVALKKCFDAFRNATDAQRTFREIMYLQELHGHANIVRLLNVIKADNDRDIYLVFDFMETDLHAVIRANILEEIHKKYVTYQLIKALKFMHSADLLHRDIKPSNLLLNADCHTKLCDFGLCRSVSEVSGPNPVLTDYVATRWYRAPEILLGSTRYTKAVDMWAVGCIVAEMVSGRPTFPGTSTMNQLERILEVTGAPTTADIESIKSPFAATMLESLPPPKTQTLEELLPKATPDAIDMIRQCLHRISADDAIKHPFVTQFHVDKDEPVATAPCQIVVDDNTKFSAADYRDRLYREIIKKKKEVRRQSTQQHVPPGMRHHRGPDLNDLMG
ncbi:hypothetical protein DYB32_002973 [Aphanomyces invadans]|uniref:Mitogen-activated protein kinase n=1 Tax=Aphanomyces invadans TaxID=157072 RepID=A0A3R6Z1X3_9STRA|nr:hypothetical protein DYB32_002973 [Aphanomyces invadans]